MIIRASQLRQLVELLRTGVQVDVAIEHVFPLKFEKVKEELITLKKFDQPFLGGGLAIEVLVDGKSAGVWRPGGGEFQYAYCETLGTEFRFSINAETHLLDVYYCAE